MPAAVADLHGLADLTRACEYQTVAERGPPCGGPVHHEGLAGPSRRSEQRVGADQVGGHRLLDHHRPLVSTAGSGGTGRPITPASRASTTARYAVARPPCVFVWIAPASAASQWGAQRGVPRTST